MAYTNIWNQNRLTGAEAANTIATLINAVRTDVQDRFQDIFATPDFTVDPLRPYGIKFTDVQDSVINFGDNGGTPRNLIIKNKAASSTYYTFSSTGLTIQPTTAIGFQISTLINNTAGLQLHQAGVQDWSIGNIASSGNFVINNGSGFAGTNYLTLTPGGAFQFIGSLQLTSNIAAPVGGFGKSASQGLVISGVTGSTNDFLLVNGAGSTVLSNPTGTQNAVFASSLSVLAGLTVSNGITVSASGINVTGGVLVNNGGLTVSAGATNVQGLGGVSASFSSNCNAATYTINGIGGTTGWYNAQNTKGLVIQNSSGSNKVAITLDASNIWQFGDSLASNFNAAITAAGLTSSSGLTVSSGSTSLQALTATQGAFTSASSNRASAIGISFGDIAGHGRLISYGANAATIGSLDIFVSSSDGSQSWSMNFSNAGTLTVPNGLTVSNGGMGVTGSSVLQAVSCTTLNTSGLATVNSLMSVGAITTNQNDLTFIGGAVDTLFRNSANNATNVSISDAGDLVALRGIINTVTGYRVGNSAATGNFLRGNGTNFVPATISTSDLPTLDTVRAYKSASTQVLSQNTLTAISFDAEDYDTNTMHDNVTNNSRLTAQTSGKYKITAHIGWTGVTSNVFIIIRKNGVATNLAETFLTVTNTSVGTTEVNCTLSLAAADYVEVYGQGDNVTPTILNNQERTYFEMQKLTA